MAARRASARLLKVLQQSAAAQPAVPSSVVFRPVASSLPAQIASFNVESSVGRPGATSFRRLYAADGQAARDVHHHEHEKTKMTSEGGGSKQDFHEAKENVKEGTGMAANKGKEAASDMTDKAKDYAQSAKGQVGEGTEQTKEKAKDVAGKMSEGMEQTKEKGKEIYKSASSRTKETMGDMTDKASKAVDQTKEKVKDTASGKAEDAKDMMNDKAEQSKGVIGGMKDQASKEAETAKDMFKDLPQKTSETAAGIKEVVVEVGKAVKRDAAKVAEKVGLKSEEPKH
ncbi:hypothetical protein Mapa_000739 [Marchantia paleacea]|nr:hypothetical protein Mapa_000739 [Marchantia paleacea]